MVHHFPGPDCGDAEHGQQSGSSFAIEQFTGGDHCPDWIDRDWLGCAAALARAAIDYWRAGLDSGAASRFGFELVRPRRDLRGHWELVAPPVFFPDTIRFGGAPAGRGVLGYARVPALRLAFRYRRLDRRQLGPGSDGSLSHEL